MRVIPAVVQHLLRSRAERCLPKIQRGSDHPRRAGVHLKEPSTSMGPELAMYYARRAVWGLLYADDACIVSRSPQGLAKMMEVVVEVCRAFALTASLKKTEIMLCLHRVHRGRWCESKQPGKSTKRCNPSPT